MKTKKRVRDERCPGHVFSVVKKKTAGKPVERYVCAAIVPSAGGPHKLPRGMVFPFSRKKSSPEELRGTDRRKSSYLPKVRTRITLSMACSFSTSPSGMTARSRRV